MGKTVSYTHLVEMKKSSAFVMVVPGLVILVVCLFLPLLKVLVPPVSYTHLGLQCLRQDAVVQ